MTATQPDSYVVAIRDIDPANVSRFGGKAASLGALARIDGVQVPAGFCLTTEAFTRLVGDLAPIDELLDQLAHTVPDDRAAISLISARVRQRLERATLPEDVASELTRELTRLGDRTACAVRSSATAEDLAGASFAGQHDSYLNVIGEPAVTDAVRRCWASLFTERAVAYRIRQGIDHRQVRMAVVVQQMLRPRAAGVLFTADPITSNRTVSSIEATFGLGEALVSGTVVADSYVVRDGAVEASIAAKTVALEPSPNGGTQQVAIEAERQQQPALTEDEVTELARLGRRIEAHLGAPQDIEWCLADDGFRIVQSRPITTLFPIPPASGDANHVYVSVGHQQMMTDAMKPLGLSFWQMTAPTPMAEAGGRLFVDVTASLASPAGREGLLGVLGKSDPLIGAALQSLVDRGDFLPAPDDEAPGAALSWGGSPAPLLADPAIVDELIEQWRSSTAQLRTDIRSKSGPELFDFIASDIGVLRGLLFEPRSLQVIMSAIDATWWINDHLAEWLGEANAADALTQSAPNNVTSEMGLALLDVADAIRPHPQVVSHLEQVGLDDDVLDGLKAIPGGLDAYDAIEGYLNEYGMRCVGEIDITRPRWAERPGTLVPLILGHVKNLEPGEAKRRFNQGLQVAAQKERQVLAQLRTLDDGESKAAETKQMIDRVRTFIGYREYPKFAWICRYQAYQQALLQEAQHLAEAGVIDNTEDIYFLTFDELHHAARTGHVDGDLIAARTSAFRSYEALTPPRVLTSDGEILTGRYHHDGMPDGVLPGLAVSAGVVEGRARILHDMADADVEPGDILVTAHTDPSWSPLFVAIGGLVTEVGGLMTHGAVVAREYGLPAVVGVEHATKHIKDGQLIRVNGTDGYVEILPGVAANQQSVPTSAANAT